MFFLVSTGPTQARPFFQVMTDTFWNLPNLLGHSSPWGRERGLVLPPGRVTPSFPEKGLGHGVPPPLHPRPHEGSKSFPLSLQEPGLEFGRPEVWPKMLREDWGAGPLGLQRMWQALEKHRDGAPPLPPPRHTVLPPLG